jgi:DNA-binding NtrC family response regulator
MSLRAMERHLIEAALQRHNGNRAQVARELGIDPSTLYRKLKPLEIGTSRALGSLSFESKQEHP